MILRYIYFGDYIYLCFKYTNLEVVAKNVYFSIIFILEIIKDI